MRWRSLFQLLVTAGMLGLNGCPGARGKVGVKLPAQPDKYDQLASILEDQDAFLKELSRLQSVYTSPADESAAPVGDADVRFSLAVDVSTTRAGIKLSPRESGPSYTLICWEEGQGLSGLKLMRQAEEAGSLRLELSSGEALSITILARWVNGRYLQVSREVVLQGLDQRATLHQGGTRWRLEGPWLPYRAVPGVNGPYGVVRDAEADGNWHSHVYPDSVMVPAIAAYNKTGGWWLASLDKAAKDLTRNYDLAWRIDSKYADGDCIELGYRYYDGVADRYTQQALAAGLPVRDAIALEPVTLTQTSVDKMLIEAETRQLIAHLGALARTFWFQPKPPAPLEPGSIVSIQQWVSQEDQLEEHLRTATGLWEARINEAQIPDAKLGPTGYGGIGASDLGGTGLPETASATLAKLNASELPTVQKSALEFVESAGEGEPAPYAKALRKWLSPESDEAHGLSLDLRDKVAAAWVLRKQTEDLNANPGIAGYSFQLDAPMAMPAPEVATWIVSAPQARSWARLALAEQLQQPDGAHLQVVHGWPSLATAPFGQAIVLDAPKGDEITTVSLQGRSANYVLQEVFGIRPWLAMSANNLALEVLSTTAGTGGHVLARGLSVFAGFNAFAENLTALRNAGSEVQVLYSEPAKSAYAALEERPAEVTKLVALLPGELRGARSAWICFLGTGGSVTVDTDNNLTVSWADASWTGKLPGGRWQIEHPSPDNVQPGDCVLVKFAPLKLAPPDTANQG
jgi:hypothetical protein